MTIVVSTPGSFAVDTYSGLVDYIGEVLNRDDLASHIPTFIHLAGKRLDRVLLPPARQANTTVTVAAGASTAILPADFKQLVAANLGGKILEQTTTAGIYEGWNDAASGEPRVFSIGNGELKLAPVADAAYTISLDYLKSIPFLSEETPSNWVLNNHCDLYLYGALLQAEAYLSNDDRLPLWKMAFDEAISEVNAQGLRYRTSGSPLRLRNPVCV